MTDVGPRSTTPALDRRHLVVNFVIITLLLSPAWGASQLALGHDLDVALAGGLVWGLGYAGFHTWAAVRRRRDRLRGAPAGLTLEQRRSAEHAGFSGPVPTDPQVLAEALRLSRAMSAETGSGRVWYPVFCCVVAAAGVVAGLVHSRWWWADSAAFLLWAAVFAASRGRLDRRQRLLEQSAADVAGDGISAPGPSAGR